MKGNLTEAQKKRCYLACYNRHADEGMSSPKKHLTTIARDMHYPVGPVFENLACFKSLIRHTNLLVTSTAVPDTAVDDAGDEQTLTADVCASSSGHLTTITAPDEGAGVDGVGGASIDGEQEKGGDLGIDVEGKGAKIDTGRTVRPEGNKAAKRSKDLKRNSSAQRTLAGAGEVEKVARLGSLADAWGQESAQKQQRHEGNPRVLGDKLALSPSNSLYAGASMTLAQRWSAIQELGKSCAPKKPTRIVNRAADGGGKPGVSAARVAARSGTADARAKPLFPLLAPPPSDIQPRSADAPPSAPPGVSTEQAGGSTDSS